MYYRTVSWKYSMLDLIYDVNNCVRGAMLKYGSNEINYVSAPSGISSNCTHKTSVKISFI